MTDPLPHDLCGIPVTVSDLIPAEIDRQFQTRTHRRSRINKKWRKRYGITTIHKPASVMFGRTMIVNTPMMAQLKARFGEVNP